MTRYELMERIGVGGMAEIFRGRAVAEGGFEKPVAIKKILPHLSQDERFVQMLMQEASILASLRQRNTVQIYDVGIGEDNQHFLVMEFVEGIDLGELFARMEKQRVRFPLDVALHIGSEVCEALDHAHKAVDDKGNALGLIHRDISPSNVLLSQSGEVKLTDFGIAKRHNDASAITSIKGKFAYMSPEQALAKPLTGRSDVYSLAVVLYELTTGRRLYSSMNDFDALRLVRKGKYPRPRSVDPNMSRELEAILLEAMALDPGDRFASAGELGAALRNHRYAISTSAGDPSGEIAGLVEGFGSKQRQGSREATVVRITTAAAFEPGRTGAGGEPTARVDRRFDGSDGPPIRHPSAFDDAGMDDEATSLHQRMDIRPASAAEPRDATPTLRNLGPQLVYQEMEETYQAETPVHATGERATRWWLGALVFIALVLGVMALGHRLLPDDPEPRRPGVGPATGTGDSLPVPTMRPALKRDR